MIFTDVEKKNQNLNVDGKHHHIILTIIYDIVRTRYLKVAKYSSRIVF